MNYQRVRYKNRRGTLVDTFYSSKEGVLIGYVHFDGNKRPSKIPVQKLQQIR